VIDEIDRQGDAGLAALPAQESQRLSGKALGTALRQLREGFVRQAVLQDGLTIPGAERELETLVHLLETLGEATVTSSGSERETEYLLRVGKNLP
ncbi:MAG TPA: hypothetical protein VHB77_08755, partial [Planctomycetaceae bacterium]|nr:hypothetical protein [Planctomycetaceae bacterium]